MNPIPFNLERAKAGDPILFDGNPARFIAHIPDAIEDQRVIVRIENAEVRSLCENGKLFVHNEHTMLSMAPKKRKTWLNCYNKVGGSCYKSRYEADKYAGPDRIACVEVEFEEGQGL